jgi:hypothetical protein
MGYGRQIWEVTNLSLSFSQKQKEISKHGPGWGGVQCAFQVLEPELLHILKFSVTICTSVNKRAYSTVTLGKEEKMENSSTN